MALSSRAIRFRHVIAFEMAGGRDRLLVEDLIRPQPFKPFDIEQRYVGDPFGDRRRPHQICDVERVLRRVETGALNYVQNL